MRYDHYQGVGSTVNPKVSLRWQPAQWVLLRASAGTGFRAPSLTDLYAAQATSVTANGTRDPINCPNFSQQPGLQLPVHHRHRRQPEPEAGKVAILHAGTGVRARQGSEHRSGFLLDLPEEPDRRSAA